MEMEEKKMTRAERKAQNRRSTKDMIICPYCHAYSYPRVFANPINDEQKEAILCGACMANLMPYVKAMEKYEENMKKTLAEKPTEDNALILENEEGSEVYVDSEKIAEKTLTEDIPHVIL